MEKIISAQTETNPSLYKNFCKMYYSERLGAAKIVLTVISVLLFIGAMYTYYNDMPLMYPGILLWLALFLIIYPNNMYRKQYHKMKDMKVVTVFKFYPDRVSEHAEGAFKEYGYEDIYKTVETNQYFYIFHTPESASVVEKSGINSGSTEELAELLKSKTKYKRKK